MKNDYLRILTAALAICLLPNVLHAVPINGLFLPDPNHCDGPNLSSIQLGHEIGDGPASNPFPIDERIIANVAPLPVPFPPACALDDGIPNDWLIRMVNVSSYSYQDLYFVADDIGFVVGNYDGVMQDLNNPGVQPSQAFRIDGTITPGANNPLLLEGGGTVNEIFEPGETWDFYVINFTGGIPSFGSAGAFGLGSLPNNLSTASILANQVPEPAGVVFGLLGTLGLLARRGGDRIHSNQRGTRVAV